MKVDFYYVTRTALCSSDPGEAGGLGSERYEGPLMKLNKSLGRVQNKLRTSYRIYSVFQTVGTTALLCER